MNHDDQAALDAYDASLNQGFAPSMTLPPQPMAGAAATPRRDKYLARLTPIADRLAVALAKFPPEVIADGLHLDSVWPLVLGRQKEKPRAFEVARALSELGWKKVRWYRDDGPSQTIWFKSEVPTETAKAVLKAKAGKA